MYLGLEEIFQARAFNSFVSRDFLIFLYSGKPEKLRRFQERDGESLSLGKKASKGKRLENQKMLWSYQETSFISRPVTPLLFVSSTFRFCFEPYPRAASSIRLLIPGCAVFATGCPDLFGTFVPRLRNQTRGKHACLPRGHDCLHFPLRQWLSKSSISFVAVR